MKSIKSLIKYNYIAEKILVLSLILLISISTVSCSIFQTFANMSRLKFKLNDVAGFSLNGINISNKAKLSDFGAMDLLGFASSLTSGRMDASFTLNIEAKNPNDGTGGYAKTNVTITSFPWRLLVDGKETVSGNVQNISVPGVGQSTVFPITIKLNLLDLIQNHQVENVINLALNLGGQNKNKSRLTLYAKPTVSTSLGNITYPDEIKIVDKEFN